MKYTTKIIETSQVSPPAGSVPETSIPLTFFDLLWLNFAPIESLFFYPFQHSTSHLTSYCLPTLKYSLSLALRSFFPLAGNIRTTPDTTSKYEIHYTDGDSVKFTVAECDRYDELFGDHPRYVSELKELVPRLCKNESNGLQPVLAIQVTVFPSQGLVIGTTLHHSTCDGIGSVNFMCTWAEICSTSNSMASLAPNPVKIEIDRSIIPDPDSSIYRAMLNDLSGTRNLNISGTQSDQEMLLATFKLKAEHIRLLKEVLLHEAAKRNVTVRCSTAVVSYAFVWVGSVKTKLNMSEIEDAYCIFAVDHRQLFKPPISENYLGNCIGPCVVQAKVNDLVGPDGFFEACRAIGKAFDEVKRVGIQDAKDWVKIALEMGSKKPFATSGSIRFKVYDVDFGWGKPAKVDIVSISNSGAMAVAPSREEQGGIEIGLCFTQRETDVFTNYIEGPLQYISTLRN
ncbi:HXXXD-type acyl-transferase family protein [Rhynchospora pubera]|uniref:HXXXD-type acyl-transferase family protein n=1 Tax=Rhynchospora pubera TaxID=906938 RepID=A0AAV8F4K8_9POAL|nr:HXXXD-type acyl-transferase family protein [Rhynchospora pubera]